MTWNSYRISLYSAGEKLVKKKAREFELVSLVKLKEAKSESKMKNLS